MKALISVSDKTGIVEFATALVDIGFEIISTGGTYKQLTDAGLTVTPIDQVTQFPEMLNGRVKTLHPAIHGGLLALRNNDDHVKTCKEHGIELIDLVVVNLYPFEKTIQQPNVEIQTAIENIDIGGPSMIRSAAKNHESVGVIVNPNHYPNIISELNENSGTLSLKTKQRLAVEAFEHTGRYDTIISSYLDDQFDHQSNDRFKDSVRLDCKKRTELRYGENPHQKAAFYQLGIASGLSDIIQHHGKELSFNNIVDLEAAWELSRAFTKPTVAIIKHTNPCGLAVSTTLSDAYTNALNADPVSAFGSIIGVNQTLDLETAEAMSELFVEAIIAPGFDENALKLLMKKPSIRLIEISNYYQQSPKYISKFVLGGLLMQSPDTASIDDAKLTVVTKSKPTDLQLDDLKIAFTAVKYVKSNAIVIAKNGVVIGVGAGQMSRVEAAEIAVKRAGVHAKGAVAASDAFFPFSDGIDTLAKAGIEAVIQPGGSKRDNEVIAACDHNKMTMVTTGIRHFRH